MQGQNNNQNNQNNQKGGQNNRAKLIRLSELDIPKFEWFIDDYVPKGHITILAGEKGIGKTRMWCKIASETSNWSGYPYITNFKLRLNNPGNVLFFVNNQVIDRDIVPCFSGNTRMENIYSVDFRDNAFSEIKYGSSALNEMINNVKPALLVFDNFEEFLPNSLPGDVRGAWKYFTPFLNAIRKNNTATLFVTDNGEFSEKSKLDEFCPGLWDIAGCVLDMYYDDDSSRTKYLSAEKNCFGKCDRMKIH